MASKHVRALAGLCLAGMAAITMAPTAFAQEESTNRVAAETDWSVFVENDPKECWSVSAPKETVNTRDGRVVAVRRGDILLFVFYRPGADVDGQVTFTGGYPFAGGSTVNLDIGGTEFELFSEGEWAWPATEADDAKIITAMKRGTSAVLTARSSRGTQTKDTFSLLGFTAAVEDAEKRCAN
ncbi:MAG: invasion associated locus B family protein [Pseudodonghicola sp.]|nr:invasion associated locus B family protein [Pseudodonghicola sp.]